MLEATLYKLIPEDVNTFDKLTGGDPYRFHRWHNDGHGVECLYYHFMARDGVKTYKKRLLVSEFRAALCQLRNVGILSRKAFSKACPISESDGLCSFAVCGRILEALHVATYSGRNGFKLTNATEAMRLLQEKQS